MYRASLTWTFEVGEEFPGVGGWDVVVDIIFDLQFLGAGVAAVCGCFGLCGCGCFGLGLGGGGFLLPVWFFSLGVGIGVGVVGCVAGFFGLGFLIGNLVGRFAFGGIALGGWARFGGQIFLWFSFGFGLGGGFDFALGSIGGSVGVVALGGVAGGQSTSGFGEVGEFLSDFGKGVGAGAGVGVAGEGAQLVEIEL